MAKMLRCGDVMPGCTCNAVLDAEDVAGLMVKAEEHAKTAHGMTRIPPEMAAKVRAAMKDGQEPAA